MDDDPLRRLDTRYPLDPDITHWQKFAGRVEDWADRHKGAWFIPPTIVALSVAALFAANKAPDDHDTAIETTAHASTTSTEAIGSTALLLQYGEAGAPGSVHEPLVDSTDVSAPDSSQSSQVIPPIALRKPVDPTSSSNTTVADRQLASTTLGHDASSTSASAQDTVTGTTMLSVPASAALGTEAPRTDSVSTSSSQSTISAGETIVSPTVSTANVTPPPTSSTAVTTSMVIPVSSTTFGPTTK